MEDKLQIVLSVLVRTPCVREDHICPFIVVAPTDKLIRENTVPVSPCVYGQDRGTLKVVTHGRKLKKPENDYIRDIVDDYGLASLVEVTHSFVDRSLLSAFTKRWHWKTSSFHLPVGEMTITLDDVSSLLHIPVTSRFFFFPPMGKNDANQLLVPVLGVSYSDASAETDGTRGPYVRLSWLRNVYENHLQQGHLEYVAWAYLLHLVGCTIFVDKSVTAVRVVYLEFFRVLASVGQIAWGAGALAYLYEQLNETSLHQTRQLTGYTTLLQGHFEYAARAYMLHPVCCTIFADKSVTAIRLTLQLAGYTTLLQALILEHFPHIMHIERSPDYVEGLPMCRRLRPHRPVGGSPVPHMPDRALRQAPAFGAHGTPGGTQHISSGPMTIVLIMFFFWELQRLQALLRKDIFTAGTDGEMLTQEALSMRQLGLQSQCIRITRTYQRKRRGWDDSTS
ncbi:Aminotransferase-like, plant mobile domain [Sesbania bispinosa]|nr:Aminotransferase-like, plant mobile domain [Sesbania bispinosa]